MLEDVLILTFGNALITANLPTKVELSAVAKHMESNPVDLAKMGFFDSAAPNYSTYYPDVDPKEFLPNEDEFIQPVVRALSGVTVHKQYMATSFAKEGVLKKSLDKLYGQTIYIDHETSIGNALGSVSEVFWQESYKTKEGVQIPAGINARLKIDGKANPRIARLMAMDPPAIHSFSVTVQFAWEPSHKEIPLEEFYNRLGTYDDKGKLYERVATEIKAYREISMVSHGADPYAKIIKDDQIVLPKFADAVYRNAEGKLALRYESFDFRTDLLQNSQKPTIPEKTNNKNTPSKMKDLLTLLAATLAITSENLTEEQLAEAIMPNLTTFLAENGPTKITELSNSLETLQNTLVEKEDSIATLTREKLELQKQLSAEPEILAAGNLHLTQLREESQRLYSVLVNGKPDENVVEMLKGAPVKILTVLKAQYEKQVDEKMPLTCKDCNSQNVTRASSTPGNPIPGADPIKTKSVEKTTKAVKGMHG